RVQSGSRKAASAFRAHNEDTARGEPPSRRKAGTVLSRDPSAAICPSAYAISAIASDGVGRSWHYLKKSIALSAKLSACECARHCKQIVWFRSSFDCPGFDTSRAPDEPKLGNGAQHAADHHVGARDTGVSKLLLIGLQYLHRALEA